VYGVSLPGHDGKAGAAAIYIEPQHRSKFSHQHFLECVPSPLPPAPLDSAIHARPKTNISQVRSEALAQVRGAGFPTAHQGDFCDAQQQAEQGAAEARRCRPDQGEERGRHLVDRKQWQGQHLRSLHKRPLGRPACWESEAVSRARVASCTCTSPGPFRKTRGLPSDPTQPCLPNLCAAACCDGGTRTRKGAFAEDGPRSCRPLTMDLRSGAAIGADVPKDASPPHPGRSEAVLARAGSNEARRHAAFDHGRSRMVSPVTRIARFSTSRRTRWCDRRLTILTPAWAPVLLLLSRRNFMDLTPPLHRTELRT